MSQTENRLMSSETNENIEKIDLAILLVDFLRAFRRMWLWVVVLAILGGGLLGAYEKLQYQPYYRASATFTINIYNEQLGTSGSDTSFFDNEAAEQMAITFPHILTSGVLQRRVAQDLGVSMITGAIQASVVENTNLFTLSVRDTDPERAYATLQAVMENYPAISEVIIGKLSMTLFDETGIPTVADNPLNLKRDVVKGAVVGAALGMFWIFVVSFMRRTIRREEDCPKYVNQKCLGSIPTVRFKERSNKKERRINIAEESTTQEYKEAIRIIRNKVERSARENDLKVILITSALAGEGKSTVAANLALSMTQEGKRVALVDCDLRNPSGSNILNETVEKGLVEFLSKSEKLSECMKKITVPGIREKNELLFIPGGEAVADGATLLGDALMKSLIASLEERMDFIILDSAPVGLLTDASVVAQYADGAVFIVKKDYARAEHILQGMEHLAESNIHIMGCVLNGE